MEKEKFTRTETGLTMNRLALLKFLSQGPKTRKEVMENGIRYNTTFRVIVDELAREGLVAYSPEADTGAITPEGRRELRTEKLTSGPLY